MLTSIVGINWGDEGKGRMVDLLSEKQDVVVKGLHSQRDFLVRFADHRVKRQLHAGILAISAEPQCRIKRFGYKRRSGNRSVIRSLAIFGYRFKKARLSRI